MTAAFRTNNRKQPATSRLERWREFQSLWLLIIISAVAPIILNGVLPANSAVMAEFGVSYAHVQWTLTVFLVALLIAQTLLGYVADVVGRRPVMIGALLVFSLGCLISATAPSMAWLLFGRFLQGFGGSACSFLPRTIVRDIYPRDRAASLIAYITMAMMLAPMFGPAFGGWVTDTFSWRYLYGILCVVGLLVAAAAYKSLRETHRPEVNQKPTSLWRAAGTLLKMPAFLSYSFLLTGSVGVYYSFLSTAPYLVMEVRGATASMYGQWFAVVAVGYLSGNAVAGMLSERVGVNRMITLAQIPLVLAITGFWVFYSLQTSAALFVPMMFVAFSNGMALPSLTTGAMSVHPPLAASASGLAGSMQIAFGILLSVILSALVPLSPIWFNVVVTASVALGLCGWYLGQRAVAVANQP